MARRTNPKPEAAVADVKPVDAPVDAETKETAPEESAKAEEDAKPEEDVVPADACEVWGSADANSKICKKCPVLDACLAKTNAGKKARTKTAERKPRAERPAGNGQFSLFGRCKANSQAGIIESHLAEPHTMAELEALTGCTLPRIKSHINWLVSNHSGRCTKVLSEGGKVHFTLNEA